ncbi:MAG: hypothetical protein WB607_03745 [Candidatus Acidiferrum sp.]|jgi:hypothetical protein
MSTVTGPRVGLCVEYQHLLDSCQKALATWQQYRSAVERQSMVNSRVRGQLKRLQGQYSRAYAMLETHERICVHCQYISKVGGLDFESLSSALDLHRRFG